MGSEIEIINESIKKIGKEFNLTEVQMNKCLANKDLEDKILNQRIEAQKNYKIKSTPTIYLNKKKSRRSSMKLAAKGSYKRKRNSAPTRRKLSSAKAKDYLRILKKR